MSNESGEFSASTDSALAQVIRDLREKEMYFQVRDGSGNLLWSANLSQFMINTMGETRVRYRLMEEVIAEETARATDAIRCKYELRGLA